MLHMCFMMGGFFHWGISRKYTYFYTYLHNLLEHQDIQYFGSLGDIVFQQNLDSMPSCTSRESHIQLAMCKDRLAQIRPHGSQSVN